MAKPFRLAATDTRVDFYAFTKVEIYKYIQVTYTASGQHRKEK